MSEQEHIIRMRSLQEWHGIFERHDIGECTQMDMEMYEEISLSFTCECGEKFYKRHKAEEHLLENE